MLTEGNTLTGGLHGSHIPVPTTARAIQQRPTPRGFAWATTPAGPDPDAITRLIAAGVLTATPEVIDNKPVRVVRKARPVPAARRVVNRDAFVTGGRPMKSMDDEAIVSDYRNGASIRALAAAHGVHKATIRRRLALFGVTMRPSGGSGPKVDTGQVLATLATGISQAETARRLGVSERTIRNHRRKAGV